MPKIQWTGLPPALRDHLFERLRERKITAEDLYQLKLWREAEPEAPDGVEPTAEVEASWTEAIRLRVREIERGEVRLEEWTETRDSLLRRPSA